ncbi:hypothetical protein V4S40_09680 [Enterococcus cecorum]
MTKKRVFSYLALIVVFIAIFSGSYYYKVSSDKRNITDSNILSTARNENPLYNQALYQVEKVNEPLDEKNLIHMGNTLFVQKNRPIKIVLSDTSQFVVEDFDAPGQIQEVDYFVSDNNRVIWYKINYKMVAVFKHNMTDVIDPTIEREVDLKSTVVHAKLRIKDGKTPQIFIQYLPLIQHEIKEEIDSQKMLDILFEITTSNGEYAYTNKKDNQLIKIKNIKSGE